MQLQIGVKVLIKNSAGSLLFIKRAEQVSLPGASDESWDIPGGRISAEEALQDALIREVKEETGIDLTGSPTLLNAQDIFVPAKDLHVVRLTYLVESDETTITLSHEHTDFSWIPLEEAKKMSVEPFLQATLDLL